MPLSAQNNVSTTITNLRVQSKVNPLAIEEKKPVFSWQMNSSTTGQKQTAYQIVVTNEKDKIIVLDIKKF